jgi:hypothetical protein
MVIFEFFKEKKDRKRVLNTLKQKKNKKKVYQKKKIKRGR